MPKSALINYPALWLAFTLVLHRTKPFEVLLRMTVPD
jgi:hypothetical protein